MFKNQYRILLEECIAYNIDSNMLDGFEHPSWSDKESELQLYQLLGKSRRACIITVEMIEERLLKKFKTLRLQSTRFLG